MAAAVDESDVVVETEVIAEVDQASEIADTIMSLMRIYGNLKARVASTVDPEIAPLFLLVRLVRAGPRRAKELAESMCADPSTVSRQVAVLVKTGLIERKADPDDGRASILVPTELGVARVQEHFVNRGQVVEPIIADWPDTDRTEFLRLLRRYTSALEDRREDVLITMSKGHRLHVAPPQSHAQDPIHAEDDSQPQPHARIERSN
jgi:DNA-binding MarR family transcriptional regulator